MRHHEAGLPPLKPSQLIKVGLDPQYQYILRSYCLVCPSKENHRISFSKTASFWITDYIDFYPVKNLFDWAYQGVLIHSVSGGHDTSWSWQAVTKSQRRTSPAASAHPALPFTSEDFLLIFAKLNSQPSGGTIGPKAYNDSLKMH